MILYGLEDGPCAFFHMGTRSRSLILNTAPVSDFAQTVKQQTDIVKIIEGYFRLRKSGKQAL
jgi:hypothetical protein